MVKEIYRMTESFPIHPGVTLAEWAEENSMDISELAERLDMTRQSLHRILKGEQPITPKTALHLEFVTGITASFWSNLERNYQEARLRKELSEEESRSKEWIKRFPVGELEKRGIFPVGYGRLPTSEKMSILLSFFGVSSPQSFNLLWEESRFAARSTKGVESTREALLSWLQLGIMQAKQIECEQYNAQEFNRVLVEIRNATAQLENADTEKVKSFLQYIKNRCASAGVAVVYLKSLKGMKKENGVAFRIEGGKKPVILLTLNGKHMDGILFSFYHEARHILSGQKKLIYVSRGEKNEAENDADKFAAESLIPQKENSSILQTQGNITFIKEVAEDLNVYTGLVIGRYNYLTKNYCRRYAYNQPSISWDSLNAWTM